MFSESATIGVFLLVVFGVACFYLYSRITYVEKRMGIIEHMLMDIKMALDIVNRQEPEFIPEPLEETGAPLEKGESEVLPEEETFYKNVLKQVKEEEVAAAPAEVVAPAEDEKPAANYETMTKDDLRSLCDKRGIKLGKRPARADIIAALRKADDGSSQEVGGTVKGDLFPMAAAADGESGFPVDMGAETLE